MGLPHDTRMPVNESSSCGLNATHTDWRLRGASRVSF